MQLAKDLLETSFLNIKEIMSRVGFRDQSHFARDFRSTFGLSPIEYRKQFLIERDMADKAE